MEATRQIFWNTNGKGIIHFFALIALVGVRKAVPLILVEIPYRPKQLFIEPLSILKRDKPASSKACLVVYILTTYYLIFLGGDIKSKKILVPSASYLTTMVVTARLIRAFLRHAKSCSHYIKPFYDL